MEKIFQFLTPFRLFIAVISLLLSIIIIVCLLITSIDKLLHSNCGVKCGFTLEDGPYYRNPLDMLLT